MRILKRIKKSIVIKLHKKKQSIIMCLILMIALLIFILSFLSLLSCRSTGRENIVDGDGIAAVKINLFRD